MIVSHAHKLIFIHVPKTAGSSIEATLMRSLKPGDVFVGALRDALKAGARPPWACFAGLLTPRDIASFVHHAILHKGDLGAALHFTVKGHYARRGLDAHASWETIRDFVGKERWQSYFTFAFERNPWDKMLSQYFYEHPAREHSPADFKEYLKRYQEGESAFLRTRVHGAPDSWHLYANEQGVQVKAVGRYERLHDDLADILKQAGVTWDGWLPNAKASFRKDKGDYRRYYDAEARDIVAALFKREIAHFGYEF